MSYTLQIIISAAGSIFSGLVVAYCAYKLKKHEKIREENEKARETEHDALCTGMQAILRNGILQAYNHRCERGWAPFYEVENVTNMYEAYHGLGGNGAVTEIYHKFMTLPQQDPNNATQ